MQRTNMRIVAAVGLGVTLLSVATARAALTPVDYSMANDLIRLPLKLTAKGKLDADTAKWKIQQDVDGTDLLTMKHGPEARAAAMKNSEGAIESLTTYTMKPAKLESSATLFFNKGQLSALTACEEEGSVGIGRICVTATKNLCQDLRSGAGLEPESMKEMEAFEMRALAAVLTLRGSDHQLDNLVKSGNRLGLKSALQTTKGQLMALAKQVTKEMTGKTAEPEDKKIAERAKADSLIARNVLEKSLPRLKQSCTEAHF